MQSVSQRLKIHQRQSLPEMVKIDTRKLGRPWHKLPGLMNDKFDVIDAQISIYFIKKLRSNAALKKMCFDNDLTCKNTQVYVTPFGHVAFDIDRRLMLDILQSYYGISQGSVNRPKDILQPISRTEERLKDTIGRDIIQRLIGNILFAQELELKHDNTVIMHQWAWSVTFFLDTTENGSFTLYFDQAHIDKMLATLRVTARENTSLSNPLNTGQVEYLFNSLPLTLNACLASVNLTVAQLAAIKTGDIIPVHLNSPVPINVADRKIYEAAIGEDQGKLFLYDINDGSTEKHHV